MLLATLVKKLLEGALGRVICTPLCTRTCTCAHTECERESCMCLNRDAALPTELWELRYLYSPRQLGFSNDRWHTTQHFFFFMCSCLWPWEAWSIQECNSGFLEQIAAQGERHSSYALIAQPRQSVRKMKIPTEALQHTSLSLIQYSVLTVGKITMVLKWPNRVRYGYYIVDRYSRRYSDGWRV